MKHIARALQVNSTLKELYMHDNGITVEGARVLAYVLPQTSIISLDLMGTYRITYRFRRSSLFFFFLAIADASRHRQQEDRQ